MGMFVNSEDPDEMLHKAAFHLDVHSLLRHNQSSLNEIQCFMEIITYTHQNIQ